MKKASTITLSALAIMIAFASCNDTAQVKTDVKKEPVVKSEIGGEEAVLKVANDQVQNLFIDGFAGGSAKIKDSKKIKNMKKIIGIVKPVIEKLPNGYAIEVTGHAAAYPTKSLQAKVSKQRAYKIYSMLKKAGVPESKISYKGIGISEPREGYDAKDGKQRRVSFKAIKK